MLTAFVVRSFLLTVLLLASCTTLEELDQQCYAGDEQACLKAIEIEKILVKRARCKTPPRCPDGFTAYKDGELGCWECVDRDEMYDALRRDW